MSDALIRSTIEQAQRVRSFLEPVWRWVRTDPPEGAALSTDFCVQSSVLLKHALATTVAGPWRLAAGNPYFGPGGYRLAAGGWTDHHWVVHEPTGMIVDVTADQFGAAPVLVARGGDPRYAENLPDAAGRDRNAEMCCEWPKDWVPFWDACRGQTPDTAAIERWMDLTDRHPFIEDGLGTAALQLGCGFPDLALAVADEPITAFAARLPGVLEAVARSPAEAAEAKKQAWRIQCGAAPVPVVVDGRDGSVMAGRLHLVAAHMAGAAAVPTVTVGRCGLDAEPDAVPVAGLR